MLHFLGGTRVKTMTSGQLHRLGSCVGTCILSEKCVVFIFIVIEKKNTSKSKHYFLPKDIINIFLNGTGEPQQYKTE